MFNIYYELTFHLRQSNGEAKACKDLDFKNYILAAITGSFEFKIDSNHFSLNAQNDYRWTAQLLNNEFIRNQLWIWLHLQVHFESRDWNKQIIRRFYKNSYRQLWWLGLPQWELK